ncbi:MAG: class I SAM-dependent methyltransferase [Candidatus Levyibacteriota bacterium]
MSGQADDAPQSLAAIVAGTLADYETRAQLFWEGTRDHDVSQNLDALLGAIEGTPPFTVLDFGCGPGRDLRALRARGHDPIGLDGTPRFVAMAREFSGCEVWQQDFLSLALPEARFDGIFANATLQHVPSAALPRVLGELRAALKPRGVLFASIPHGHGEEGWNRGRYSVYHEPAAWYRHLEAAGLALVDHYYRPAGLPRASQPWLATVSRNAG